MKKVPIVADGQTGYKVCPEWLRVAYRAAANWTCQECNGKEAEIGKLQPHRVKRKQEGGLYTVCPINIKGSNVKMLCKECHKEIHKNEFSHVSHSY